MEVVDSGLVRVGGKKRMMQMSDESALSEARVSWRWSKMYRYGEQKCISAGAESEMQHVMIGAKY